MLSPVARNLSIMGSHSLTEISFRRWVFCNTMLQKRKKMFKTGWCHSIISKKTFYYSLKMLETRCKMFHEAFWTHFSSCFSSWLVWRINKNNILSKVFPFNYNFWYDLAITFTMVYIKELKQNSGIQLLKFKGQRPNIFAQIKGINE